MIGTKIGNVGSSRDRWVLRLGAVAGALGVVLEIAMGMLHAGHTDPNDSATVFLEYSVSDIWTAVHIGQFFGAALIGLSLLTLGYVLVQQNGIARAFAAIGALTAVTLIAVFAVQMAVDGVALKATINAWVAAPHADKPAAFYVAEGVRWIEKGLSGFFNILNGVTLIALGMSLVTGAIGWRVLGAIGVVGGLAFVTGGYSAAHTGFSAEAGAFLGPGALLSIGVLLGVAVFLWSRSRSAGDELLAVASPSPAR
jgi:hypothetical protein